ncbi:hypothetical protein LAZ67_14003499 [Cordylochernes scorpioides]|uniref:Uncharacterized protein n=1 Tax=Cordylochernes scorpioides TaxID=51811 RepID=A0ABY6L7M3_9ARAC|nr:hypothetical protein LAZ67_14003499 [Cordylochernes scorpioides]
MLGFHHRAKGKTSLEDDDVPIDDDTTTKPLFTPQEKGRKGREKVIVNGIDPYVKSQLIHTLHVWIGVSFDKQWRPDKPLVPPSCNMCKTP